MVHLLALRHTDIETRVCIFCKSDDLWRYGADNPLKCGDCGEYQTSSRNIMVRTQTAIDEAIEAVRRWGDGETNEKVYQRAIEHVALVAQAECKQEFSASLPLCPCCKA